MEEQYFPTPFRVHVIKRGLALLNFEWREGLNIVS